MLQSYSGTLIVVSHDTELLRHCIDTLWHIDNGKIHVFSGNYDDYIRENRLKRASIEGELELLSRQKKDVHHKLMQEQQRAAKSKAKGEKKVENRKWLKMVGDLKGMKAEKSQGKKLKNIDKTKNDLSNKLADLRLPEIIMPKFSLSSASIGDRTIVSISDGSIGYEEQEPLLQKISLSIGSRDRIAIQGDNASGKSTLIKAILDDASVIKSGNWHAPKISDLGYLDQNYGTLSAEKTVLETIAELVPTWTHIEVRRHLNDFLFRKNEEVTSHVAQLSGGEKARLSLAQIAARTPKLLILDEITNNLDLETKEHVAQVLKAYPGAMIVISHDADFLEEIGVNSYFKITDGYVSFNAR
jgi:ATPase subunit of ABC transporter with duplicated ATPase domains